MIEFKPKDFQPGNYGIVTELMMSIQQQFTLWISERYGLSDRYSDDALIETAISFRDLVDQGLIRDSELAPADNFFSLGAQVGRKIAAKVFGHYKLHPPLQAQIKGADTKYGIKVRDIICTHRFPDPPSPADSGKIEQAISQLNPESQELCRQLSRTGLGRRHLAKAMRYGTEKGLADVESTLMQRLAIATREVFGESFQLNRDFRKNRDILEHSYMKYVNDEKLPLLEKIRGVELGKRDVITRQIVTRLGMFFGLALLVILALVLLNPDFSAQVLP